MLCSCLFAACAYSAEAANPPSTEPAAEDAGGGEWRRPACRVRCEFEVVIAEALRNRPGEPFLSPSPPASISEADTPLYLFARPFAFSRASESCPRSSGPAAPPAASPSRTLTPSSLPSKLTNSKDLSRLISRRWSRASCSRGAGGRRGPRRRRRRRRRGARGGRRRRRHLDDALGAVAEEVVEQVEGLVHDPPEPAAEAEVLPHVVHHRLEVVVAVRRLRDVGHHRAARAPRLVRRRLGEALLELGAGDHRRHRRRRVPRVRRHVAAPLHPVAHGARRIRRRAQRRAPETAREAACGGGGW